MSRKSLTAPSRLKLYRKICRNYERICKLRGMDYRRTTLQLHMDANTRRVWTSRRLAPLGIERRHARLRAARSLQERTNKHAVPRELHYLTGSSEPMRVIEASMKQRWNAKVLRLSSCKVNFLWSRTCRVAQVSKYIDGLSLSKVLVTLNAMTPQPGDYSPLVQQVAVSAPALDIETGSAHFVAANRTWLLAAEHRWLSGQPDRLRLMAIRVQSPVGSLRIFARGNVAGRYRWSAGFLKDLPLPPPHHSGTVPYSPQSPSSTSKISIHSFYTDFSVLVPTKQHQATNTVTVTVERVTVTVERATVTAERATVTFESVTVTVERVTVTVERERETVTVERERERQETVTVERERETVTVERERETVTVERERETVTVERATVTVERATVIVERETLAVERETVTVERLTVTGERSTVTAEESDSDRGESDSDRGESDSDRGESDSDRGESDSDRGESDSDRGESDSDRGESDSDRGESDSDRGESDSDRGESDSDQRDSDRGEIDSDRGESDSDRGESDSDRGESDSDRGESDSDLGVSDSDRGESDWVGSPAGARRIATLGVSVTEFARYLGFVLALLWRHVTPRTVHGSLDRFNTTVIDRMELRLLDGEGSLCSYSGYSTLCYHAVNNGNRTSATIRKYYYGRSLWPYLRNESIDQRKENLRLRVQVVKDAAGRLDYWKRCVSERHYKWWQQID
ncbi:hypothetical protein PR048_002135 [Dryococelus australis]|uniref:Uncharacterized protein n=1 Tax=Dryococelus australis TaxID=614101 RepID=A0ABQ9IJC5_9NEOP|nr:hypothetical protein PR048_002135 [Dryococelus australis]